MHHPRLLAFDLNGTLTDLSPLDKTFRAEFGGSRVRREWFTEVLKLAFSITAAGHYEPFSEILSAALKLIEQRHDRKLSAGRRQAIVQSMRSLPAFPEVHPALKRLRARGFRLVVLTNSGPDAAKDTLKFVGLDSLFDHILSADSVRRLKPAPDPYHMAARQSGLKPSEMLLVAAHSWDIAGAHHAGCHACFVARPGQVLDELTPKPGFIVSDLAELADKLHA